ncbi:MAG TPA: Gfo/Idh/MocA family oxidoreductase [Nocardioidaceae bacterium]|nr:Gfo/Idh/MocA family oxidoreductase [Nocardioidaceae bacterium]
MNRLRIGVVGAGAMGAAHVRTLATSVSGAEVTRVYDLDPDRAAAVAVKVGASPAPSESAVIESPDVDAVVIAAPDPLHAELTLACLKRGLPVLCEKPLATNAEDARQILDAEAATGRSLVQVGFMRRFDPGYLAMRRALTDGDIGEPRLLHCVHRNPSAHPTATSEGIVRNSMVHELDVARWLLGEEIVSIEVRSPHRGDGLVDPQLATLEMASGVLVSIEVFVNAGYGYDVRSELVGTAGTVSLEPPVVTSMRQSGRDAETVAPDFVARFGEAYRAQLAAWVDAAAAGRVAGATAWDGYVAGLVADAGVASLRTGERVPVELRAKP